jgi:TonB family protein
MRRRASTLLLALLLGAVAFSPSLVLAQDSSPQEQTETKRKIVNKVLPTYPELARRMQMHGIVRVEVVIAPSGKLKTAQVIGGNPVLAKSAVDAIEQWKWAPAPQETQELIELSFHP